MNKIIDFLPGLFLIGIGCLALQYLTIDASGTMGGLLVIFGFIVLFFGD